MEAISLSATVTSVDGGAVLTRDGQVLVIVSDMQIFPGDRLETQTDSHIQITLPNGQVCRLDANTSYDFTTEEKSASNVDLASAVTGTAVAGSRVIIRLEANNSETTMAGERGAKVLSAAPNLDFIQDNPPLFAPLKLAEVSADQATEKTVLLSQAPSQGLTDETAQIQIHLSPNSQNGQLNLDIQSYLFDKAAVEDTVSILLSLPEAVSLSSGQHIGGGVWLLTLAQLPNLTIFAVNVQADLALQVTININGDMSSSADFIIEQALFATQEAGVLKLNLEDFPIDLNNAQAYALKIIGLTPGSVLSNGEVDGTDNTIWHLNHLNNVYLTPPPDFSGTMSLALVATVTEVPHGSQTVMTELFYIDVDPQAHAPIRNTKDAIDEQNIAIPLDVNASSPNAGEARSVTIAGVPEGAGFDGRGQEVASNTWQFNLAELPGLSIRPPMGLADDMHLIVTALSQDDATTVSHQQTIDIIINTVDQTLIGNNFIKTLMGGDGYDVLTGGLGADEFIWQPMTSSVTDTVTVPSSIDGLNLSDLLPNIQENDLSQYLHFTQAGNNTVVSISTEGDFNQPEQVIILENFDATLGGTLSSDAAIIDAMIANNQLII